jgi:hypothetical protein
MKTSIPRVVRWFAGASLGLALLWWASSGPVEPTSIAGFRSQVVALDQGGEVFAMQSFLGAPEFQKLAAHGPANIPACLSVLGDGSLSFQGQVIAIMSMHRLEVGDYVVFLSGVFELARTGKLGEDRLEQAIGQPYTDSTVLIENCRRPEVVRVLDRIAADPTTPEGTKKFIADIKSGKVLAGLRRHRYNLAVQRLDGWVQSWFGSR